MSVNQTSCF